MKEYTQLARTIIDLTERIEIEKRQLEELKQDLYKVMMEKGVQRVDEGERMLLAVRTERYTQKDIDKVPELAADIAEIDNKIKRLRDQRNVILTVSIATPSVTTGITVRTIKQHETEQTE